MRGRRCFFIWLGLLTLLASAGCGKTLVRSGDRPVATAEPSGSTAVGSGLDVGSFGADGAQDGADGGSSVRNAAADPKNSFVLELVDHNGLHPAGIEVRIAGTASMTLTSDSSGRVVVSGAPGYYTYEIAPGCQTSAMILRGTTGRFGIAEGQPATAQVKVEWNRRYGPYPVVFSSIGPYWPLGEDVKMQYDVIDRCPDGDRAPHRSLAMYRLKPSPNIQIVGEPQMKSDGKGYAHLTIRCTAVGDASIVIEDTLNPDDTFDIAKEDRSSASAPSCADI